MIREILPPDTHLAFHAMQALRTELRDEESFVHVVDEVQRQEGYRLIAAFEETESQAVAVAGFRTGHSLSWVTISISTTSRRCRRQGAGGTGGRYSIGSWKREHGWAAPSFTWTRESVSIERTPIGST